MGLQNQRQKERKKLVQAWHKKFGFGHIDHMEINDSTMLRNKPCSA